MELYLHFPNVFIAMCLTQEEFYLYLHLQFAIILEFSVYSWFETELQCNCAQKKVKLIFIKWGKRYLQKNYMHPKNMIILQ
jgi:hypothetical protein